MVSWNTRVCSPHQLADDRFSRFCTIRRRAQREFVGDLFERLRDPEVRPDDAHHRVVGLRVVEIPVAAPLREERPVPVGHEIAGNYAHCIYTSQGLVHSTSSKWN